jgi:hydrogenase maturation protease
METRTLVLGIGNTLLSDEGAGVHALVYLQTHHPDLDGVAYLDGGTLSFTLAEAITESDNLVVLDAAQLGADPGTVRGFVGEDMDRFLGTTKRSVHEVGLLDLLDIARLSERLPANRALIGIQPEKLDWGDAPTEPVSDAIPEAAGMALKLIESWRKK